MDEDLLERFRGCLLGLDSLADRKMIGDPGARFAYGNMALGAEGSWSPLMEPPRAWQASSSR